MRLSCFGSRSVTHGVPTSSFTSNSGQSRGRAGACRSRIGPQNLTDDASDRPHRGNSPRQAAPRTSHGCVGRKASDALRAAELIEKARASVYFADERVHTADEHQWEAYAREVVESEAYRCLRTGSRRRRGRRSESGIPGPQPSVP